MLELEQLLGLFVAAVLLAALARRVGAPYPVFLAIGGALLALLPGGPSCTIPPELALALFVAHVLLDAAKGGPRKIDTCYACASHREVVLRRRRRITTATEGLLREKIAGS